MIWLTLPPLVIGLVYLACDAEITTYPRAFLVALVPFLGRLLGCRICTSAWMCPMACGMVALFQVLDTTWQTVYGVCVLAPIGGVGISTILTALSPAAALRGMQKHE
jgi:hypothetical protein